MRRHTKATAVVAASAVLAMALGSLGSGTMIFDGIARSGASCESPPIFEGPVYGVPGVTRLFGPGLGPQVEEFLYDRHGNIVGSDQPNVKVEGNSAPNSNSLDCNTPEGFRRAPFSSTVELY